ncbi:MAG TPA: hypothetical protein VFU72_09785, partial [Nitrolancea sp.]|nr:hypothetical protein [Nitrolancea sp.]
MMLFNTLLQYAFDYAPAALKSEKGQDFAEYAIILALVVIIAAAGFSGLGNAVLGVLQNVSG